MTKQARSRALLALAAIVVLAVAAGTVVAIVMGLRNADDGPPEITAYADGRTVNVPPYRYCPIQEPLCESPEGPTESMPVREGHPLQLSLPKQISEAPWLLAAFYLSPSGLVEADSWYGFDDVPSPAAVTVQPFDAQGRQLVGVEVRLPTGIVDVETGEEAIISHAVWSIATLPDSTATAPEDGAPNSAQDAP